jgi:hypothetical protein
MDKKQDSLGCIKCHMPEVSGGAEKMDKRSRGHHASHKFLGIHDVEFRKTGVDINISTIDKKLSIKLTNKMGHPLIIQPARAKFLKITISRAGKIIWKNYTKKPSEDKQGYFAYSFKEDSQKVIIPAHATKGSVYNLEAKETKVLEYTLPLLQKSDKITVGLYLQLAKSDCAKVIDLNDSNLTQPQRMKEVVFIQK